MRYLAFNFYLLAFALTNLTLSQPILATDAKEDIAPSPFKRSASEEELLQLQDYRNQLLEKQQRHLEIEKLRDEIKKLEALEANSDKEQATSSAPGIIPPTIPEASKTLLKVIYEAPWSGSITVGDRFGPFPTKQQPYSVGKIIINISDSQNHILNSIVSTKHPFETQMIQLPHNVDSISAHFMDAASQGTGLAHGQYRPLSHDTRKIKVIFKNEKGRIVSTGRGRSLRQTVYPDQLKGVIEVKK
jgi:hypothetical protein